MEAHEEELGPVDIVVIGYPAGAPMTGEAVPLLLDLVDRGIIRVLDALFVTKNEDGTFSGFEAKDLDDKHVGDFAVFEGASSGLLGDEDVATAAEVIEPGSGRGHDRLREPLGGAVRRRSAPQRRRSSLASQRIPCRTSSPPSTPPRRRPDRKELTMPGLLRGMARTAVVAGTATAVSNRVSRRQAQTLGRSRRRRHRSSSSTPRRRRPRRAAAAGEDRVEQLKELAALKEQGVLTDEEFGQREGARPRQLIPGSGAAAPPRRTPRSPAGR